MDRSQIHILIKLKSYSKTPKTKDACGQIIAYMCKVLISLLACVFLKSLAFKILSIINSINYEDYRSRYRLCRPSLRGMFC